MENYKIPDPRTQNARANPATQSRKKPFPNEVSKITLRRVFSRHDLGVNPSRFFLRVKSIRRLAWFYFCRNVNETWGRKHLFNIGEAKLFR